MTEAHIPDDILDLLTGYALEALSEDEMLQVRQLLAERPDLRVLLSELRETVDKLPDALPEAMPPADLRQRTLDYAVRGRHVPQQSGPTPPAARLQRLLIALAGLAGAACLAAALAWGNVVGLQGQLAQTGIQLEQERQKSGELTAQLEQERQKSGELTAQLEQERQKSGKLTAQLEQEHQNRVQVVGALAAENTTIALRGPGGTGTAVRTQHGAIMIAAHLPPLAAGRTYQLWLIHNQVPVSGGTFAVDPSGHGTIMLAEGTAKPDAYSITEEPEGGSAGPTTAPLVTGKGASAHSSK